jgi:2-dehydro-3-deoxygluconokinase
MIFCFGELLLRLSPSLQRQWITKSAMPVYIGGAELNVATALAKWKTPVKYFTALPDNYLSREIIEELNAKDIDTSAIHLSGNRIGSYYLPQGTDLKNAGVIYDRAHSSFAELKPGMIDWENVLTDCTWFHFSAISPALSQNAANVCKEALDIAVSKGLTISVDLNYRAKLWQYGKRPEEIMPELVKHCRVIMGNLWAVESLLGIPSPVKDSNGKHMPELLKATKENMLQLHKAYPRAASLAYTFRLEKEYWAVLQHGAETKISRPHFIGETMDKVGSGDCFMAGLIYGLHHQRLAQYTIDFAAAAAVGKLQVVGDATNQDIDDINKLMN